MKTRGRHNGGNKTRAKLTDFTARGTTTFSVEMSLRRHESLTTSIVLLTHVLNDATSAADYLADSFSAAAEDWFDGNVEGGDQLIRVCVVKYSHGTMQDTVYELQPVDAIYHGESQDE